MSPLDIEMLLKRRKVLKKLLKEQHSLPKSERDLRAIDKTKPLITKIDEWLGQKREQKRVDPVLKKNEFRDQYKKEFGIEETDQIIKIDDIEQLDKAWPNIAGKNVTVDAPAQVKAEILRRIREIRSKTKFNGFR